MEKIMAIKNQPLEAEELPADFKRRVVVKFKPGVDLPYSPEAADVIARQYGGDGGGPNTAFEGVTIAPYFPTLNESEIKNLARRAPRVRSAASAPDLTLYYAVECPDDVDPESVAKMFGQLPNVEIAYVEGIPEPPPVVDPLNDPRNPGQRYLDAAPIGIEARWAWGIGLDGSGIGFVDMEQGWRLDHEDLAAAAITIISGVNHRYFSHGTSVLGEVVAVDNTVGGVGIAPECNARVVSQWRTTSKASTAEAILSAVNVMSVGDVLLLEAQTRYSTSGTSCVPVEVEQVVFDAIRLATSQGIVVVEAAANGSFDLDTFEDVLGRKILNRNSSDFRDSGAIMVGAATSANPHQRLGFSNFGSRIDCYAWGEDIDTTVGSTSGTNTTTYTPFFNGTSGASPIVAGAAVIIQSWRLSQEQPGYAPDVLRGLLSDPTTNTPSANPATDRIGVMPDIKKIIESQQSLWAHIMQWLGHGDQGSRPEACVV
jgi:subtilisin family serine protease